jgi:hypothetical protein
MLGKLLCKLGVHDTVFSCAYLPSIDADIVTDFIYHANCRRCGKIIERHHSRWDGKEMVDVTEEKE